MASRKEQKEQARAQRLEQEQQAKAASAQRRRLQIIGGVVSAAIVIVVVLIVISSSGGASNKIVKNSPEATAAVKHVDALLAGIPESGNTLGKADAPITITEYGDLECSVCDVLATPASFSNPEGEAGSGWEDQLITNYVRTGKAKLVFRSLETASSGNPDQNAFEQQQAAALAAGKQDKAWYYIELMYNQQGKEDANYVTEAYLQALAKQIKGLNFSKWMSDRNLATFKNEINSENTEGTNADVQAGYQSGSTPTVVITGPGGTAKPIVGLPTNGYAAYTAAINSVL